MYKYNGWYQLSWKGARRKFTLVFNWHLLPTVYTLEIWKVYFLLIYNKNKVSEKQTE